MIGPYFEELAGKFPGVVFVKVDVDDLDDVAAECGMATLQRRAAVHLAELWRERGRRREAVELLAPIHARFDQGITFDDHRRAAALLTAVR